jgi:hypothetical protein
MAGASDSDRENGTCDRLIEIVVDSAPGCTMSDLSPLRAAVTAIGGTCGPSGVVAAFQP